MHKELVHAFYQAVLNQLLQRIRRIRPELHRTGKWMLLHDNTPPHSETRARQFLAQEMVTVLDHPPYYPYLSLRTSSCFPAWRRPSIVYVLRTWIPSENKQNKRQKQIFFIVLPNSRHPLQQKFDKVRTASGNNQQRHSADFFERSIPQEHGRLARWIKWRACDVGKAKERLEIELWRRWSNGRVGEWAVT